MRQFFTWGFWLSLGLLAVMALGLYTLTQPNDDVTALVGLRSAPDRHIDLIGLVYLAEADPGFEIVNGETTGNMQIRIDGFRYMNILPNTPGENRCAQLTELATCAVAADLLGEAVLWFSIIPIGARQQVVLPPVTELLDDGTVRLDNGWIVRHADQVERLGCDDTTSLTDFIARHGEDSTTEFSLEEQAVVSVTCAAAVEEPTEGTAPTSSV
ncbi:MAG: hypothetical protein HZB15_13160 [Actinobacteria bacterium]|nr:hypothetical protein [Actinomycetota bacterium]